ncbi:hypothetical protein GCM10010254_25130 [Streptomyces chromofuscus]|nr:hypothetical protein GCM10010254_25130 [Streptomyces chromofuscus]
MLRSGSANRPRRSSERRVYMVTPAASATCPLRRPVLAAALTLTACGVPPSDVIQAGEPASGMFSLPPSEALAAGRRPPPLPARR